MAAKNGDGIVFHRSDCSEGKVRLYPNGGDGNCSVCDTWGLTNKAIKYIHVHPEINHKSEDVMGEKWADSSTNTFGE